MSFTSRNEKEIDKLLKLAGSFEEERDFQRNSQYRKFKDTKMINRTEGHRLISGLHEHGFKNECIFWYKRILEVIVCTSDEHYEIYCAMSGWYVDIFEYETALEYGLKALNVSNVSEKRKPYWEYKVLNSITVSCVNLKRYKVAKLYLKKYLNLCARGYKMGARPSIDSSLTKKGCYTPPVITQNRLLECCMELLTVQIRCKSYSEALKTCEKIKFFNLYSMNPNDILKSLESNGYKNFLPNTVFQKFEEKEEFKNIRVKNDFLQKGSMYEQFFTVAKIWMQKCVMFKALDNKEMLNEWIETHEFLPGPFLIIEDLMNDPYAEKIDVDILLCALVYTAITFAECKPIWRQLYFHKVLLWFLKDRCGSSDCAGVLGGHCSRAFKARHWISRSMKENQMDSDQVMPLIQCFIKTFALKQKQVFEIEYNKEAVASDLKKGGATKAEDFEKECDGACQHPPYMLRRPIVFKHENAIVYSSIGKKKMEGVLNGNCTLDGAACICGGDICGESEESEDESWETCENSEASETLDEPEVSETSEQPFDLSKVPHDLRMPPLYNMLEYRNSLMIMNHFKKLE